MRKLLAVSVLLILCFLAGLYQCSKKAGRWENDAGNWEREFGTPPPQAVQILHSSYWRSPHPITLERHYAFHIKSSLSLPLEWVEAAKLKKLDFADTPKLEFLKAGQPEWFAPRPVRDYKIYLPQGDSPASFGIIIDREAGEWFVTDRS